MVGLFTAGITAIEYSCFKKCTNLANITIPSCVRNFSDGIIYNCQSLTTIEYEGTTTEWINLTAGLTDWNYNVPAKEVKCSNGTVSLQ